MLDLQSLYHLTNLWQRTASTARDCLTQRDSFAYDFEVGSASQSILNTGRGISSASRTVHGSCRFRLGSRATAVRWYSKRHPRRLGSVSFTTGLQESHRRL